MQDKLAERIFICGFMGAGKSTIGQALAQKLGQSFYDLDEVIETQAQQTITQIFEAKGEATFRELERDALTNVACEKKGVIALGGGSLQNQPIVDELKSKGVLVFIRTSMDTVLQRVIENEHRPMLWDENGQMKPKRKLKKDLQELYRQRLPLYLQADVIIPSNHSSAIEEITDQLKKILK